MEELADVQQAKQIDLITSKPGANGAQQRSQGTNSKPIYGEDLFKPWIYLNTCKSYSLRNLCMYVNNLI